MTIFVLVAIVVPLFVVAVDIFNPPEASACVKQGCNAFFWMSHTEHWVGHQPGDPLRTLFTEADRYNLGDTTLLNALKLKFPRSCQPSLKWAVYALLQQGVAARLNVSNPNINYSVSGTQVTTLVNNALASGNAIKMLRATRSLISWNSLGCPFDNCKPHK
jgi:hypothetical protein